MLLLISCLPLLTEYNAFHKQSSSRPDSCAHCIPVESVAKGLPDRSTKQVQ